MPVPAPLLLSPLASVYLFANAGWLAVLLLRERRLEWLTRPELPLLVVATGSIAILVGQRESRVLDVVC